MVLWNVGSVTPTSIEELCYWQNKLKLAREAHLLHVFLKALVAGIMLYIFFIFFLLVFMHYMLKFLSKHNWSCVLIMNMFESI